MPRHETSPWPPLPYADWEPTKQTLHRYCQILGKIRMALTPPQNHWWHVTLYVGTRGLTTGPMPDGGRDVEIALDLVEHRLRVTTSDGDERSFPLTESSACAAFYQEVFAALDALGTRVAIRPEPFDLGDSPAFPQDFLHDAYDPDAVARFWRVLAATQRVLRSFAGSFRGKASPVHLFWHSFDLAHARYSGRPAALAAGADPVTAEAYSHEVIAFGFWPGDDRRTPFPAFYSYTAPEPDGLRDTVLEPAAAEWQDTGSGSGSVAILPYDRVRTAPDPETALLSFFASAFQAGSEAAGWDARAFGAGAPAT